MRLHGQDRSGPAGKGFIDINASATENLERLAKAKGEDVRNSPRSYSTAIGTPI
jgi:hypothetical protein